MDYTYQNFKGLCCKARVEQSKPCEHRKVEKCSCQKEERGNEIWDDYKKCECEKKEEVKCERKEKKQTHTHEFVGSTKFAEEGCERHNHRFAGVTGEAIKQGCSHVHKLETKTDFCENHFHEICDTTSEAIEIGCGKHIHLVKGKTSKNHDHKHEYIFATLIESPACCEDDKEY